MMKSSCEGRRQRCRRRRAAPSATLLTLSQAARPRPSSVVGQPTCLYEVAASTFVGDERSVSLAQARVGEAARDALHHVSARDNRLGMAVPLMPIFEPEMTSHAVHTAHARRSCASEVKVPHHAVVGVEKLHDPRARLALVGAEGDDPSRV